MTAVAQSRTGRILVLDDEPRIRELFESVLAGAGHDVLGVATLPAALEALERRSWDLILTDIMLGCDSGVALLQEVRRRGLDCPVVLITGYPTHQTAAAALRLGAFDYLAKPVRIDQLEKVTRQALEHHFLRQDHARVQQHLQAIFHSVQEALVLMDGQERILELNQAARTLCRIDPAGAVGKPFHAQRTGCDGACAAAIRATLTSGVPHPPLRIECRMTSGPIQVNEIVATPVTHAPDSAPGCLLVVRNQTHLVNLERSLQERHRFHRLIGKSRGMLELYEWIEQLGSVNTTVLITGESGTGKELAAEALHRQRPDWQKAPLVKVHCGALAEHLLESELFGHVKGAFTGAIRDKVGRFERANSGTLFLDEIGDISPRLQLQLLRVVQEREFERVGDATPIKATFRLVAATNRDLARKVREGLFREDLYHRLNVVHLHLPPLRERREDIPLLAFHFIEQFNREFGKTIDQLAASVLRRFLEHPWPGNVRELENTIEHACLLCRGETLHARHLPAGRFGDEPAQPADPGPTTIRPEEDPAHRHRLARDALLQHLARPTPDAAAILDTLQRSQWNKTRAAALLGVSRRTFYRLLARLGDGG
ncbi:MAG: sigma 54-interacting transcriptional regulator [Magnetococcales bacterium]|nr:sigma 54-interacting transcriptional regulator [Magnetococcales bacterium]